MRRLWVLSFLVAPLMASPAWAAGDGLSPLGDALAHVRSTHGVNEMRNAGPELTPVKQLLRSWLQRQFPAEPTPFGPYQMVQLPEPEDFAALSLRLNKSLDDAGLTCGDVSSATYRCSGGSFGQDDARGYLGEVRLSSLDHGRYLLLVTAVGIHCGFDESAYIYVRGPDHKWRLLLQNEKNRYGKVEYAPENFLSIDVSPANVAWNEPAPPPLVLTLGYSPWCSSNWQALSIHLWRASGSTPTPTPLIDKTETLYIGDDQIASARLTQTDLLIEYQGRSIDSGTLVRSHVEHYRIDPGDKLERIAPVALSPNDFVEEWLTKDWWEASHWTGAGADASVSVSSHTSLHTDFGDFDGSATRCRWDPTLWQVGFAAEDPTKPVYSSGPESYFLVRWTAPYRFSLVRIQRHPFSRCDVADPMPDNIGTLIPGQGWTR